MHVGSDVMNKKLMIYIFLTVGIILIFLISQSHDEVSLKGGGNAGDALQAEPGHSQKTSPVNMKKNVLQVVAKKILRIKNTKFEMIYVDGVWSEKLRHEVFKDINLVYKYVDKHVVYEPKYRDGPRTHIISGEQYKSTRRVRFLENGYTPDAYNDSHFGDLVEVNGKDYIVIPKQLMDVYRKALDLKRRNSIAFESIDKFVDRLNHLEDVRPGTKELLDMFFFLGYSKQEVEKFNNTAEQDPARIVRRFGFRGIRNPSLLNIKQATNVLNMLPPELVPVDSLVAEVYQYSEQEGLRAGNVLIYHQKRWKVLILPMGT